MSVETTIKFSCTKDKQHFEICKKVFIWDELSQRYSSLLERENKKTLSENESNLRIIVQSQVSVFKEHTDVCFSIFNADIF